MKENTEVKDETIEVKNVKAPRIMKTVNTCEVVLMNIDANGVLGIVGGVYANKTALELALPEILKEKKLDANSIIIAPLYWKVSVITPEVKTRIKVG